MKFKSLLSISLIFLLFVSVVSAGTGEENVKVIDKEGKDVTDGNKEDGESSGSGGSSNSDNTDETNSSESSKTSTSSSMDAASEAVETGLVNTAFTFADYFLEEGFKFNSVSIDENKVTGSKAITYSVNNEELNPFKYKFVRDTFFKTGGFYFICSLLLICLAYCVFVWQRTRPVQFSNVRESLTGREAFFDFNKMLRSWSIAAGWPVGSIIYIIGMFKLRNIIVAGLAVSIVTVMSSNSSSLPTYFITNATWYFNIVQRSIAGYGIILLTVLVFVIGVIIGLIHIFHSKKVAHEATVFLAIEFFLLVFMDIQTIFFMWVGVNAAEAEGNPLYALAAMLTSFVFDGLILVSLPVYIFLKAGGGTRIIAFVGL